MGYLLGIIVAISSFLSGRRCATALYHFRNPTTTGDENLNETQHIESNDQNSVSYSISTSGIETTSSQHMFVFYDCFHSIEI